MEAGFNPRSFFKKLEEFMTYVAPGPMTFRRTGGDMDSKICTQLALIDAEIDGAETRVTNLEGGRAKFAVASLAAGNANAFCFNWQNQSAVTYLVLRLIVKVATPGGTPGAVLDFGVGATATTHSDNIIDGMDANAAGFYDNILNKGSNGAVAAEIGPGQYITGQILTQNAAALAGLVVILYI